jgi:hypothetical protein
MDFVASDEPSHEDAYQKVGDRPANLLKGEDCRRV